MLAAVAAFSLRVWVRARMEEVVASMAMAVLEHKICRAQCIRWVMNFISKDTAKVGRFLQRGRLWYFGQICPPDFFHSSFLLF